MCAVRAYDVRASGGVRRAACVRRTNPTLSDVDVSHAHARAHTKITPRACSPVTHPSLSRRPTTRVLLAACRAADLRRHGRRAGGMYPGGYIRRRSRTRHHNRARTTRAPKRSSSRPRSMEVRDDGDGDGDGVKGGGEPGAHDPHTPVGSFVTEGVRRRVGGVMCTPDRNGGGDGVRTPTMTMSDETPPVMDNDSKAMENLRRWTVEDVADATVVTNPKAPPNGLTSVWNYCALELGFRVGQREDDPDMSHARERVFDLLWYIPVELEKFCLYGGLLCADAILGLFTSLPVRVASQTVRLVVSAASRNSKTAKRHAWGIHPYAREHLNDVLWLFMLTVAVTYTHMLDVSVIYHYIRGQEVMKLYMMCHVLETFDKLLCSFNSNVMDALQNSVHNCVNAATNGAKIDQIKSALRLVVDTGLSTGATVAHTFVLLTHAVTLSVAINSHTNAMLLVLISNNFSEMKGHVFKKQDPEKLFGVSRLDVIERVHLSVCLLFVTAQRIMAAGTIQAAMTRKFVTDIMLVIGSEIFVDIVKHSFMAKFNGLRPGVYRRFYRQMCRDHVHLTQSYKIHQVVGFVPLAPAAVIVRFLPGLYQTLRRSAESSNVVTRGIFDRIIVYCSSFFFFTSFMFVLVCFKLAFGIAIHTWGTRTLGRTPKVSPSAERWGAKTPAPGNVPPTPRSPPRIKVN